jgi:hypothetical protein
VLFQQVEQRSQAFVVVLHGLCPFPVCQAGIVG